MNSTDSLFQRALGRLLTEIIDGSTENEAYILNPGDPGLLRQLDTISAEAASKRPMPGKTTIASHVDHVCYGFSLLTRWAAGEENPWATADWDASWRRTKVDEEQWRKLRDELRRQTNAWRQHVEVRTDWNDVAASGALASAAHTAYHLGAIRQILAALNT